MCCMKPGLNSLNKYSIRCLPPTVGDGAKPQEVRVTADDPQTWPGKIFIHVASVIYACVIYACEFRKLWGESIYLPTKPTSFEQ